MFLRSFIATAGLLCVVALVSCQQVYNSFSNDPTRYGNRSTPDENSTSYFAAVQNILDQKCGSCHADFLTLSETQWKADTYYVIAGDPDCSRLFYRITGSGATCDDLSGAAQDMPRGDLLSDEQLGTLRAWILDLAEEDDDSDDEDDDEETPDSGPTASERTAAAVAVIAANCAACHGSTQVAVVGHTGSTVPAFASYDEDEEFVGADLVSPGNADESWIYQALMTYGEYDVMPKGASPLSASDAEALRTWIEQIGSP